MAAVATAPINIQIVFATSSPSTNAGWKTKLSLMVAAMRYINESIAKTDTKRSKLVTAGPLPVDCIILAMRIITKIAMRNWKPRRPRLSALETIVYMMWSRFYMKTVKKL